MDTDDQEKRSIEDEPLLRGQLVFNGPDLLPSVDEQ